MVRYNLQLAKPLADDLAAIRKEAGCQTADLLRAGLALLKVAHQARLEGKHIGLVGDPKQLDTELVGIF